MHYYAEEGDYCILVMELMGNSLEKLFQEFGKKFSLKTILMLVDQMIKAMEQLHTHHYIHRDIKPDNFVIGLGNKAGVIHLIDFGLSKRFRDPITGLHIPYKDHKSFTGTARYASIKTHFGIEQSRRDDLESLGHLFIYLLKGVLPWQNMPAANKKEKYEKIRQKKVSLSLDRLCSGLPIEFQAYLNYTRSMKFNERPDYVYILRIFKDLFDRKGLIHDNVFDWMHPWTLTGKVISNVDKSFSKPPKKHLIQAPPKPSGDKENKEQEGKTPTATTTLSMINESQLLTQANL